MAALLVRRKRTLSSRRAAVIGFTLIEVMIVVLVIGVLVAIANASYKQSVIKSRRAAAAGCLQERAQFMERYYTTKLKYKDAPAPVACNADVALFYAVSFVADPTDAAFTLQAVPQGVQASKDTECGTLTINQQGLRGKSGTASSADACW